ncbi:MAG: flagellar biosynthetic protein FliR, partial [Myxococcales bacterium]|nr:flagellar biosynthetic protein FliR [Myxococcales bacterium]
VALGLPAVSLPVELDAAMLLAAGLEVLLGAMVGFCFRLFLAAADYLAVMVAQVSWLSVPTSMSVDGGGQSQALAQVAALLALLLALGVGAHRIVLAYLLASFDALPVGSPLALAAGTPVLLDLGGRALDVGLRLAVPVFAISLGVQAGLAMVARIAPSLQIFNVGFAVLVATGVVTFGQSLRSVAVGLVSFYGTAPDLLDDLFTRVAR